MTIRSAMNDIPEENWERVFGKKPISEENSEKEKDGETVELVLR